MSHETAVWGSEVSTINPSVIEVAIVLVGAFEPYYMTPDWFKHHHLFSDDEIIDAKSLIPPNSEVSHLLINWAEIFIERNRLQVKTTISPYIRVNDFVVKLLSDVLNSTPIYQMGINFSSHYPMDFKQLEEFGNTLVPREPWGEWGKKLKNDVSIGKPSNGLLSLSMRETKGEEYSHKGFIDVRVETSKIIENNSGVHVFVNDHFDFGTADSVFESTKCCSAAGEFFDASLLRAEKISSDLVNGIFK